MSKLLINENPLILLPSLVMAIGMSKAIVLQQVQYWLSNPKAGVEHEGHKWVHNTYEEWQSNFPFWGVDNVRKIINALEEDGLLLSAKTSKNPFDHTKSYRIDYKKLEEMVVESGSDVGLESGSDVLPEYHIFSETTIDYSKNTMASVENQPQPMPLSIENQIFVGKEVTEIPNSNLAAIKDAANLVAMGTGSFYERVYNLAYAFMVARNIILHNDEAKGNRKAARMMVQQGVQPHHIVDAVQDLAKKNMTVVNLFSVQKTAVGLANPAKSKTSTMFSS